MKLEYARSVTTPFGKWSGWTLGTLCATREGRRYMRWMLTQEWISDWLMTAVQMVLDAHDHPRRDYAMTEDAGWEE